MKEVNEKEAELLRSLDKLATAKTRDAALDGKSQPKTSGTACRAADGQRCALLNMILRAIKTIREEADRQEFVGL